MGWVVLKQPESAIAEAPIQAAGHSSVPLGTLGEAELSGIDVLWILAEPFSPPFAVNYPADLANNVSKIESFVAAGGTLLWHDRQVALAPGVLPGGAGFEMTGGFVVDVDVGVQGTLVTDGPGGMIDDMSLDTDIGMGDVTAAGFTAVASLPPESLPILVFELSGLEFAVDFSYGYELGFVHYSSIPMDAFLTLGTPIFADVYGPNVVAHAVSLPEPAEAAGSFAALATVTLLALRGRARRGGRRGTEVVELRGVEPLTS